MRKNSNFAVRFTKLALPLTSKISWYLLLSLITTSSSATSLSTLQLATEYQEPDNIKNYLISEKLDGIRGVWTGKTLLTKQGNTIQAPTWFTQHWPNTALDGELWSKRDNFEAISSCVRNNSDDDTCWQRLSFMVFDMPPTNSTTKLLTSPFSLPFSQRAATYKKRIGQCHKENKCTNLQAIKQFKLDSISSLMKNLDRVVSNKGEGLMLHHEKALYQAGRSTDLMKLKKHFDAEAIVIKHLAGKGKYKNHLGSLLVTTVVSDNFNKPVTFRIGTGFSDKERINPPKVGDIITFKYFGKTKYGTPRFASFMRVRYKK